MMHQELAKRGRYFLFCGRDVIVTATVGRQALGKARICIDCAAAALRLLSSISAGERVNKIRAIDNE
jgi:hypothetical protein